MQYPIVRGNPATSTARTTLTLSYGGEIANPGPGGGTIPSLDDAMHRVQSVRVSDGGSISTRLVEYDYFGAANRAGLALGDLGSSSTPAVVQTFRSTSSPSNALPGLDAFGQVRDLHYANTASTPQTLWRGQFGYDRAGNRTSEAVTAATGSGTLPEWSSVYGYDGLNRLQEARRGDLDYVGSDAPTVDDPAWHLMWVLDRLGNWSRQDQNADNQGYREDHRVGSTLTRTVHRQFRPNARNEIDAVASWAWASPDPGNEPEVWQPQADVPYTYDNAGRLIYDGTFVYDYDYFGRLVQVRRAGGVVANQSGGTLSDLSSAGQLVAHYSYDALGRLIRVQRPEDADGDTLRVTDLYYDGARVVQEAAIANVPAIDVGMRPDESVIYGPRPADGFGDHDDDPETADLDELRRLEREYVWAMDPMGYIDELHAQLAYTQAHPPTPTSTIPSGDGAGNDFSPTELYSLTNPTRTVQTLTDFKGDVVAQYGYTPYGEMRLFEVYYPPHDSTTPGMQASVDAHDAALWSRIGHQGLRFDRHDRPWLPPMDLSDTPNDKLGEYAGLYHNRNRMYSPSLGRFTTRDPNASGQVVCGLWERGSAPPSFALSLAPDLFYANGMSLHQALGSNGLRRFDPNGLEFQASSLLWAMGVQGLFGGAIGGYFGGWEGAALGFVGGALGGAAGYGTTLAFGASASGLWAALGVGAASGAASGATQGAIEGFGHSLLSGNELQIALADAAWNAMLGGITGGVVGGGFGGAFYGIRGPAFNGVRAGADDIMLGGARDGTLRSLINKFRVGDHLSGAYNRETGLLSLVKTGTSRFPRRGSHRPAARATGPSSHGHVGFGLGPV